jgi:hypothetical protein
MGLPGFLLVIAAVFSAPDYEQLGPIIIQSLPASPDKPLIIAGCDISRPDAAGIQDRDVAYVDNGTEDMRTS